MGPRITPYQFNEITAQISDIYVAVEDRLFEQVVKRLKAPKTADKDFVLEWQAEKMQKMRILNAETIEALAEASVIYTHIFIWS